MVRKITSKINGWLESRLRRVCAPLSQDARVFIILGMLVAFGALSVWMTFSSIYHFGKEKAIRMQMEHIEQLELQQKQREVDSIKQWRIEN